MSLKRTERMAAGEGIPLSEALDGLPYNADGLVPAIAQQYDSGEVLMMAWMNRAAIEETLRTGRVCYWSRSRQAFWRKGESSGHRLRLVELRINEYDNALLVKVEQVGPGCCHLGYRTCFHRKWDGEEFEVVEERVFDPEEVYGTQTCAHDR